MELLYQLQLLRELAPGALNTFFVLFSEGSLLFAPVLGMIIYWSVDKERGEKLILAFSLSNFFCNFLKVLCCVYRPWIRDSRLQPAEEAISSATGYSFPSAHCALAGSVYCGTAYSGIKKKTLLPIAAAMLLLMMFTRMYLGCHTLQDVTVGAAIGLFFAFTADKLHSWLTAGPGRDAGFLAGTLLLCAVFLLISVSKAYPLDYNAAGDLLVDPELMQKDVFGAAGLLCAAALGFFLEHRYFPFPMPSGRKQQILRCFLGTLLFLFVYLFLTKKLTAALPLLPGAFLRYFLSTFTATNLYPLLLTALRGKL